MTGLITISDARLTSACLLGDPCFFNLSPMHNEQSGRVVGRTFGKVMKFDIETPDGAIHQNITDVRLDCAASGELKETGHGNV